MASNFGTFTGRVRVEWLDDHRRMMLLEPISYVDPDGVEWRVPAGYVTDGASIPQPLWGITGGPFEGPHRKAAVFHDWYCCFKPSDRSSVQTHRMFYCACRAAGLGPIRAWLRWASVRVFGPRWS